MWDIARVKLTELEIVIIVILDVHFPEGSRWGAFLAFYVDCAGPGVAPMDALSLQE